MDPVTLAVAKRYSDVTRTPDAPAVYDRFHTPGLLTRAASGQPFTRVSDALWTANEDGATVLSTGSARLQVDAGISDAWIETTVKFEAGHPGVFFRGVDASNYWFLRLGLVDAAPRLRLFKMDGGAVVSIQNKAATYALGGSYRLVAHLNGDEISAYLDDELVFTYAFTEAEMAKYGAATLCGLYSHQGGATTFRELIVRPLRTPAYLLALNGGAPAPEPGASVPDPAGADDGLVPTTVGGAYVLTQPPVPPLPDLSAYVLTRENAPLVNVEAELLASGKGGTVGTSGRAAIALRLDDWQDDILSLGFIDELHARGFPASIVLCAQLGSHAWNSTVTYDDIRHWCEQQGMEVYSHGVTHDSPGGDPDLIRWQILESKAMIEAQNIRVMGWAQPGVLDDGYVFNNGVTHADFDTYTGRLLRANYALIETDIAREYRVLPSPQRIGLGYNNISDGHSPMATHRRRVMRAIAYGWGMELMLHVGNLDKPGNPTYAEMLDFLDFLAGLRDAGKIVVVAPSTLPFVDPASDRWLSLLGDPAFTTVGDPDSLWIVNSGGPTSETVPDGPDGGDVNVMRMAAATVSSVYQQTPALAGRGFTQPLVLEAWARGVSSAATARIRVKEAGGGAYDYNPAAQPIGSDWTLIRHLFTPPPSTQAVNVTLVGDSTEAVEWTNARLRPA